MSFRLVWLPVIFVLACLSSIGVVARDWYVHGFGASMILVCLCSGVIIREHGFEIMILMPE